VNCVITGGGALEVLEELEVEVEVDVKLALELAFNTAFELALPLPPVGEELPVLLDIVIQNAGNLCYSYIITFRFSYNGPLPLALAALI
jgi:hypothetical protein